MPEASSASATSANFRRFENSQAGWLSFLEKSAIRYDYIAYRELAEGKLGERSYGALILPYAVALSQKEADEVRKFARAGGLVVADARVGLMDEHCRPREKGVLEDLFGVTGARLFGKEGVNVVIEGQSITAKTVDDALRVTDGNPRGTAGETAAVVENKFGQGRAVYLNFYWSGISIVRVRSGFWKISSGEQAFKPSLTFCREPEVVSGRLRSRPMSLGP